MKKNKCRRCGILLNYIFPGTTQIYPPSIPSIEDPTVCMGCGKREMQMLRMMKFLTEKDSQMIIRNICQIAGYSVEEILGNCRRKEFVRVRKEIAFCLRDKGLSLPHIGRLLNRHHSTILHLLKGCG